MSLKLQAEYGDDLQVLFVEVQGADDDKAASFALGKKWLGGRAMWTTERPFDLGIQGIPQFGLLSAEGELVLSGYSTRMASQIDETIAEMVKAASKPSKDLPKDVAKALIDANKGAYAKALDTLDRILADERAADAHGAAEDARGRVTSRVDKSLKRVEWMLDNGYPVEADALFGELQKGLKGAEYGAERVTELAALFATDEAKAELEAGKALARVEEKLYEEGANDKARRSLEKLVEKHAGTKVAARASALVRLAS